jgi:very-short-patch-repair endonuclease
VLAGAKRRRQVPLGGRFIADFVAPAARLVVEVDGAYHARRRRADAARDRKLARLGYRVVRVDAELALRDVAGAVALIRAAL